jgi:hypothetical protein
MKNQDKRKVRFSPESRILMPRRGAIGPGLAPFEA